MPIPRSRYMAEPQNPGPILPGAVAPPAGPPPAGTPQAPLAPVGLRVAQTVNPIAQLVADILEPTGLIPLDRLAAVRARAGQGSLAQAIRDEGLASEEGVARSLAERYHLPYVDLHAIEPEPEALAALPPSVLERVIALPYRLTGSTLQVAIPDPGDVAAVDE